MGPFVILGERFPEDVMVGWLENRSSTAFRMTMILVFRMTVFSVFRMTVFSVLKRTVFRCSGSDILKEKPRLSWRALDLLSSR
jgi:hypothetical protein